MSNPIMMYPILSRLSLYRSELHRLLLLRFLFVFSSLFHHCCCSVITRYDVGYGSVSMLWNAFMIEVVMLQVLCSDQINESHRIKICGAAERTKRRSSSFNFTMRIITRIRIDIDCYIA